MIKTKTDAIQTLDRATKLKAKAEALMQEYGIKEILSEADNLKREVTKFCVSKSIPRLELSGGRYSTLIRSVQDRVWVGTKADIPEDAPDTVKPLKSLVEKEVWMKITRRIPDPEKIEAAVAEGLITLDQIAPAYFERYRSPYLRVFEESVSVADEA